MSIQYEQSIEITQSKVLKLKEDVNIKENQWEDLHK